MIKELIVKCKSNTHFKRIELRPLSVFKHGCEIACAIDLKKLIPDPSGGSPAKSIQTEIILMFFFLLTTCIVGNLCV